MLSVLKNTVILLLLGLLLLQVSVDARDEAGVPTTQLNIELPEVEGWEKGKPVYYPTKELGYSVTYRSEEGGVVTIYIYNGGRNKIPNNLENDILKNEVDEAKKGIFAAQEMGRYQGVKEEKSGKVKLAGDGGKLEALYSRFNMNVGSQAVTTEIYLFSHQNHFIKIRATRPRESDGTKNPALEKLMAGVEKALVEPEQTAD